MKPSVAAVHPELQKFARMMPKLSFSRETLWLVRFLTKIWTRGAKIPAGIQVRNLIIPSQDGKAQVRLRVYRSQKSTAKAPALLWIHGGGYILGVPEMDDLYVAPFVQETGAVVVSVDYRLAPDSPFPTPLEDCYAALLFLASQSSTLDIDPGRIAIGGESAGGGLAAALAQIACERGQVRPVFQLLVYPMLDDRTATRKDIDPEKYFVWNNLNNTLGWESYLKQAPGGTFAPANSVPSRRSDLTGLPPAWIGVGNLDLFHDEDLAYAERLKEAGIPCELVVVPGAFHGFDSSAPHTQLVKDFRRSQVAALKKYFA
jgi:acetyl esterase/lipase